MSVTDQDCQDSHDGDEDPLRQKVVRFDGANTSSPEFIVFGPSRRSSFRDPGAAKSIDDSERERQRDLWHYRQSGIDNL